MTQTNDVKFWQKIVAILLAVFVVLSTVAVVLFVNYNKLNKDGEDKKDTTQTQNIKPNQNDQAIAPNNNKPSKKNTVQFGWYPQKRIKNKEEITILNAQSDLEWKQLDTGHENLEYGDVAYGGKVYRAIRLKNDDSYLSNNMYTKGETYWFEFEQLEWEILDEKTGLAICTTAISYQPARRNGDDYIYSWLKDDFKVAFKDLSEADKEKISEQTVDGFSLYASLLEDKDFNKYGMTADSSSDCELSDYAYFIGNMSNNQRTTNWWLRNTKTEDVTNIVDTNHFDKQNPTTLAGVRPVIYYKPATK